MLQFVWLTNKGFNVAKIFLDKNDVLSVNGTNLQIFGSLFEDSVRLSNLSSATVNSNVDSVQFEGLLKDYQFSVEGNQLKVWYKETVLATIGIQADSDGTELKFADASISAMLTGLNQANVNGVSLSTSPQSVHNLQASNVLVNYWYTYGNIYLDKFISASQNLYYVGDVYTGSAFKRDTDLLINKIDSNFSPVESVYLGDANEQTYKDAVGTLDGGLLVTGRHNVQGVTGIDSYISKLSTDLAVEATIKIGTSGVNDQINQLAARADGKFVAVGYQYTVSDAKDAYVLLLNNDMTVAAEKRIDNSLVQNSNEEFYRVFALQDNSIIADAGSGIWVHFNENLNIIKTLDFSENPKNLVQMEDGSIYIHTYNELFKLNTSLGVEKSWKANFSIDNMVVVNDRLMLDSNNTLMEVDVSTQVPVVLNADVLTNRQGNPVYANQMLGFQDATLLVDTGSQTTLFSLKPSVETQANLSGDYRINQADAAKLTFAEQTPVNQYLNSTSLNYSAGEISLVGRLDFSVLDVTGNLTLSNSGSLIA